MVQMRVIAGQGSVGRTCQHFSEERRHHDGSDGAGSGHENRKRNISVSDEGCNVRCLATGAA